MTLPPTKYVLDALSNDVLPAAGGGAFVLCLFLVFGRWAGALGSAAAVVVAFLWANFTLTNLKFDEKPTWENTWRLIPWKVGEEVPGWHWLPRAALVLIVVGLLSRWLGLLAARLLPERQWWGANLLVWAPRVAAVALVSGWLSSGRAASEPQWQWLRYELAGAMLLVWVALDGAARPSVGGRDDSAAVPGWVAPDDVPPTGAGGDVAAYLAASFIAAGVILLCTHNAKFMEVAVILGCAMFGIAVAAGAAKADASGAIPAGVAFLPGLVLGTRPSHPENHVPIHCFWLVALAPLVLVPFLIPALSRKNGWVARVIRAVLVLAPLAAAVFLASQHEKLVFEEEW
jgi:hypothetical protein